jgi:hypothetical protein
MEQVKLLSMTVVLTVLVWASADSLVNETVSISVTFEPVPAPGSNILIAPRESAEVYELQVSGPRSSVESAQSLAPLHIRLDVEDRPTGSSTIALERAMLKEDLTEQWNEFRKLTVVSVQPDLLPVKVDHWTSLEVGVVLKRLSLAYDVEPQLSRASTVVTMRESLRNEMPSGQPPQIDITADVERLLKEQPVGQSVTITIPAVLDRRIFGPDAQAAPSTIDVTATVKAQRRTAQIPTVPILFAVSFANLEKPYRAIGPDGTPLSLVTQTITVTGSTDAVTRLERGTSRVYGIIQLKQDDLEQVGTLKLMTPEYYLPQGVELAEEPPPIEFRLIDATDTEVDG